MGRLVAVVAEGSPGFVTALRRVWEDGDAVLPLDPRLPGPARDRLLAALRPAALLDPDPGGRDGEEVALDAGAPPVEAGDALVVPTSGTTGQPKGVVLTHDAVVAHARAVHARLEVTGADRWLACLPLAHVGGLGVVTRALVDGVGLDLLPRFEEAAVAAARDRGATLTSLVPTALDRVGAEGWRWVVLGGAADTAAARPANVVRTWGLTETGGGIAYDGAPLAGVEVAAVGGELWVRSPTLLRGYRRPDGTVEDPRRDRPGGGPGWLPTGDAGEVRDDGTVVVWGRQGDMIVTGGENVWPEAVEAVLRRVPGVAEVAVAGRPDPGWGQRVEAWVVPSDPASAPTLDALRAAVAAELAPWAAPRALHLVAALPRTALGKVRRSELSG
ncbi:MAG TPA: fatty acid--CoA ligase family protein [Acidimicrobiales bacterium]|nr:fatty acid--CoA ligase family protein [Acidimicrobiales bacterium]